MTINKDTLDLATGLALVGLVIMLSSCASKPDIWRDKYGIIHNEKPEVNAVTQVQVLFTKRDLPGTCVRLRNVYLEGNRFKDWELQLETAKMSGTHVVKEYYNGVKDIMGITYDCRNHHQIKRRIEMQKRYLRDKAMGEIERRNFKKGKHKVAKDTIPTINE